MEGGGIVTDRSRDGQRRRRRRIGSAAGVVFFILLAIGIISESHAVVSALSAHTAHSVGANVWTGWRVAHLEPVVLGTGGYSSGPRAAVASPARTRNVDGGRGPGSGVDPLGPHLQLDHRGPMGTRLSMPCTPMCSMATRSI